MVEADSLDAGADLNGNENPNKIDKKDLEYILKILEMTSLRSNTTTI